MLPDNAERFRNNTVLVAAILKGDWNTNTAARNGNFLIGLRHPYCRYFSSTATCCGQPVANKNH